MDEEGYISDDLNSAEPDTSSDDEAASGSTWVKQVVYDNALPLKHAYLGDGLEEVSGRTLLEEGSLHKLPILVHSSLVLVPGQTLPLNVLHPVTINMLRTCVAGDRTFGVLCTRSHRGLLGGEGTPALTCYGTTAEIYAWEENTDNPHATEFRVKARGRQRFKVVVDIPHSAMAFTSMVMILREKKLPDMLRWLRPRGAQGAQSALMTAWPAWVHAMYDAGTLADQMKHQLKLLISSGDELNVPCDPVLLSYWSTQNLPLTDEQRLELLAMDSAVMRLRYQLSFMQDCRVLACSQCSTRIADHKDVFSMSCEGPQGTYVNPGGFIHETLTVYEASGLMSGNERPSYEYSWFPGYSWTTVLCHNCGQHMGWMFIIAKKKSLLRPKSFFGLSRASIKVKLMPNKSEDLLE